MGSISTVYGRITGKKSLPIRSLIEEGYPDKYYLFRINKVIIDELPDKDEEYPFISRTMFHVPEPLGDFQAGTARGQVITFGATYKDIEEHWLAWLTKFEEILEKLYWYNAVIHLESEYYKTHTYKWKSNVGKPGVNTALPSKIEKREWEQTEFKLQS